MRPTVFCLLSWLAVPASHAAEFGYLAGMRGEYTDNIRLVREERRSEWLTIGEVGFLLQEMQGEDWYGVLRARAEYRDYLRNTYNSETRSQISADLTGFLVPRRLSWTVEDYYGQTRRISSAPDTPDNLVDVNVLLTGPTLWFDVTPVDQLNLAGRSGRYRISGQASEAELRLFQEEWLHRLSGLTSLALVGRQMDVSYPEGGGDLDYARRDHWLRYRADAPNDRWAVELGQSRLARGDRVATEPLANANWNHQIRRDLVFNAHGGYRLGDTVADVAAAGGVGGGAPLAGVVGGDVTRVYEASMGLGQRRGRSGDDLTLFRNRYDYELSQVDQEQRGGRVQVGLALSDTLIGGVFGSNTRVEFWESGLVYRDHVAGARMQYQVLQHLFVTAEIRRQARTSTDWLREFDENRLIVGVVYNEMPVVNNLMAQGMRPREGRSYVP